MSSLIASFKLRELFPIGRGGMGTTSLACASTGTFERLVVVKRLHEHLCDDDEARQRLLEEAQLAGYVHHANVVGMQHAGVDERGVFLVLDFVEGASLRALLRACRPENIPVPVVLRIILDCLSGLQAIHSTTDNHGVPLDILHRDVTPENILLGLDGVARLADFGIAKSRRSMVHTAPLQLVGKLPFMAPEYVDQGKLGPPLDVYAVGVSLWRLLVGHTPFRGLEDAQLLVRILTEGVPAVPEDTSVSPRLRAIVARACARDPRERYASAEEMRAALEDLAESQPVAEHAGVAAFLHDVIGAESRALRDRAALALSTPSIPPPSAAGDDEEPTDESEIEREWPIEGRWVRRDRKRRSLRGSVLSALFGSLVLPFVLGASSHTPPPSVPSSANELELNALPVVDATPVVEKPSKLVAPLTAPAGPPVEQVRLVPSLPPRPRLLSRTRASNPAAQKSAKNEAPREDLPTPPVTEERSPARPAPQERAAPQEPVRPPPEEIVTRNPYAL